GPGHDSGDGAGPVVAGRGRCAGRPACGPARRRPRRRARGGPAVPFRLTGQPCGTWSPARVSSTRGQIAFSFLGQWPNGAAREWDTFGQAQHRVVLALGDHLVEEVPRCQAIHRLRLEEERGQVAQRLPGPNQDGTGWDTTGLLADCYLQENRL